MRTITPLVLCAAALSGCAALSVPADDDIAKLPVVDWGQAAPKDGEYVLRYPADSDLTVVASVEGSLMSTPARAELKVRLKRDVYVYRNLASFDGRHWQGSQAVIGGSAFVSPPGYAKGKPDPQAPGEMRAVFDLK